LNLLVYFLNHFNQTDKSDIFILGDYPIFILTEYTANLACTKYNCFGNEKAQLPIIIFGPGMKQELQQGDVGVVVNRRQWK
jgi:hypothetical protein